MILTDRMLEQAFADGKLKIEPYDGQCIQPASYDLGVGSQAITSSSRRKIDVKADGFVEIDAGDFAIVVTEEVITLDNQHVGRFGLRSVWARRGLIATTGPQIDPGFSGRLKVGLTNLSSKKIALSHLEHFLTVEFHHLSEPVKMPYSGPYQKQTTLSPEDLSAVLDREVMSLSEMNQTLRTLSSSVSSLEENVKSMRDSIKSMQWVVGLGIAFIGIGIAFIGTVVALK